MTNLSLLQFALQAFADQVFQQFVVPENRNIPRGTLQGFAKIDLKKPHAPCCSSPEKRTISYRPL